MLDGERFFWVQVNDGFQSHVYSLLEVGKLFGGLVAAILAVFAIIAACLWGTWRSRL